MDELSTNERISRMFQHKEADRVPIVENSWPATVERWRREGMGEQSPREFFGLDNVVQFGIDNSPRYPEQVKEETEEYRIKTTKWGMTVKNWKHKGSTPENVSLEEFRDVVELVKDLGRF